MNSIYKPTGREIAKALGVSPPRVSQLRRDGMPTESVEAALAWYRRRVDPLRSHGQRASLAARREVEQQTAAVQRALELASGGEVALAAGTFDGIESELRAALRAVAPADRARLALPAAVWRVLTADVYAVVDAHEDVEGPLTADDAGWLGDFWYGVAAGEIRVAGPAEHAR